MGIPLPNDRQLPRAGPARSPIGLMTPVQPDEVGSPPASDLVRFPDTKLFYRPAQRAYDGPRDILLLPASRGDVNSGDTMRVGRSCSCPSRFGSATRASEG
jgi:hypothetical protein